MPFRSQRPAPPDETTDHEIIGVTSLVGFAVIPCTLRRCGGSGLLVGEGVHVHAQSLFGLPLIVLVLRTCPSPEPEWTT
ncbi:MAG: hypothetical protein PVSMB1_02900 [Gemmatimonadaceae bacterium]